jgi:hypothetical protein
MPSTKPHVLIDEKYHKVLVKINKRTKIDIPELIAKVFDSSELYSKMKKGEPIAV